MPPDPVEELRGSGGQLLAMIVRAAVDPDTTTFLTPPEAALQLGFVVYRAGGAVAPHRHRRFRRELAGTSEVLFVRSGRCVLDLFDEDGSALAERELAVGDVALLVGGGHGVRMLENTTLLEVKQGPYTGLDEKEAL